MLLRTEGSGSIVETSPAETDGLPDPVGYSSNDTPVTIMTDKLLWDVDWGAPGSTTVSSAPSSDRHWGTAPVW